MCFENVVHKCLLKSTATSETVFGGDESDLPPSTRINSKSTHDQNILVNFDILVKPAAPNA